MRIIDVLIRLISARDPNCPNEADVLAYSENRLSSRTRAQVERHFAGCHDCMDVLAFLGRQTHDSGAQTTDDIVSKQTNRVLAYIENDERQRNKTNQKPRSVTGFNISYPRLATVGLALSLIVVAIVFAFTMRQSSADAGMEALKLAVKDARYSETRVAGGFDHSPYAGSTRGDNRITDSLHFDRAEGKVAAAALKPGEIEAKMVLARVHLSRGNREDAKRALEILNQLRKSGVETPELINDMGVAQHQLNRYQEAINSFNEALVKAPRYEEALFNKALAEQDDHRFDEANRDWQLFISQSANENWKTEARTRLSKLAGASDR